MVDRLNLARYIASIRVARKGTTPQPGSDRMGGLSNAARWLQF